MKKQEEVNKRLIFGLKLKQARTDKGFSLSQLSQEAGISISFLNEIEKGKKYPKAEKIASLTKALGVTEEWIKGSDLDKNLSPVSELIQSNILHELPLNMFGLKIGDLLDLLSNAPSKLNAFIGSLIEVTKNYDLGVETFYFAVMRSYQEIHENYFQDLEEAAQSFADQHDLSGRKISTQSLEKVLVEDYNYTIIEDGFIDKPELKSIRSYMIPKGRKKKLYLNRFLSSRQKAFILGKELGYSYLKLDDRPFTSTWVEVNSFDQVINNFKASYFSSALLINQQNFLEDLEDFLSSTTWRAEILLDTMEKYNATAEMIMQRLTNLLPRFFGIKNLFFLRFNHEPDSDQYELNKELHLSRNQGIQGTLLREHHCRRWMAFGILRQLGEMMKRGYERREIGGAQRIRILDSGNEYLTLNLARPNLPTKGVNSSMTLGLLINETLEDRVKFLDDKAIGFKLVNETCERCRAQNCKMRAVPPRIYQFNKNLENMKAALKTLG